MPLVRLMKDADISWSQRKEIAWAIQESKRKHESLMLEHRTAAYKGDTSNTQESENQEIKE